MASNTALDYTQSTFPYTGLVLNDKFKGTLFPHQEKGVEWMLYREQIPYENIRGGLIFDEMGLGKTLCALSTIVLSGGLTLIIVPAQLVYVWESEILRHFDNISYFVYHGPMRKKRFERFCLQNGEPQMLIMSYQSVPSDIDDENGPLSNLEFYRIVFDECHFIKNHHTAIFRAVRRIRSTVKWFLSGTPIMNKIHEMYPYLKLLNYKDIRLIPQTPQRNAIYNRYSRNDTHITKELYMKMQDILKAVSIRRTKDILTLPTKTYVEDYVNLNINEKEFYDTLREYSKQRAKKLTWNIRKIQGSGLLPNEQNRLRMIILQNMLSLIFYLRLACCDPLLVIDKIPRTRDLDVKRSIDELKKGCRESLNVKKLMSLFSQPHVMGMDCPVCFNDAATVVNTSCHHMACADCWKRLGKLETMRCFTCFDPTTMQDLKDESVENIQDLKKSHDERVIHCSTKTRAVLDLINDELDKGNKVCVISQWTSYLDILLTQFKRENRNVPYVMLDGRTSPLKRQKSVNAFQDDKNIKVCFASLGSSAEGITLHSACTMIICDVYWNKAKISQVSDRIHRIGQENNVTIHCMYVKDSIEMKLKDLVDKKDMVCKVIVDCMPVTHFVDSWLSRVIKLLD